VSEDGERPKQTIPAKDGDLELEAPTRDEFMHLVDKVAHVQPGGKEAKLDWIRKANLMELEMPKVRDALIREAREADASWDEVNEALDAAGYRPDSPSAP
jgi:hypothetical protein